MEQTQETFLSTLGPVRVILMLDLTEQGWGAGITRAWLEWGVSSRPWRGARCLCSALHSPGLLLGLHLPCIWGSSNNSIFPLSSYICYIFTECLWYLVPYMYHTCVDCNGIYHCCYGKLFSPNFSLLSHWGQKPHHTAMITPNDRRPISTQM